MNDVAEALKINKKTIRASLHDMVKSAKAVDLVYVSDDIPGIHRKRAGKHFFYMDGDERVKDKLELDRIKKLSIPPAWKNVWICKLTNGHLQATGFDVLKRKQYRYHSSWNLIRKHTKFYKLHEFGKHIPVIRTKIEQDLSLRGYPKEKILAAVISLLDQTNIRVGNSFYEKLYGSFGLTTLKNHHIKVTGAKLYFTFKGKKNVKHNITLKSKKLARIVKGCKDIPGKELFEYYDTDGSIHSINSGMVNNYIRHITGGEFTAKDFRTWAGTVTALNAFGEIGSFESTTEMNQKVAAVYDQVAKQLGNTRTVCKNYYVHPAIVDLYKEKKLEKYLTQLNTLESNEEPESLRPAEMLLLKILEKI